MNDFQERLHELLNGANKNRLKLAQELSISSTTINGYFNDGYYPKLEIAIKMAKYFECSLDYLLGLSDSKLNQNVNAANFIANFDGLLKENKISIAKAMREMNMSEYNYYRWKSGRFPKTLLLIEIAKYFGVSIDFLVGNTN